MPLQLGVSFFDMASNSCDLLPKGMPPITFLPGVEDEHFDSDTLKILYEIHSEEKKQMIAFQQTRYEKEYKEELLISTRSKKRERENQNKENDDLPDDKSTTADSLWSSFECRKKLKAKEKELSSSSATRDFIQECEEYQEYLSSISASSDDSS